MLEYALLSCCSRDQSIAVCDYSQLVASYGASSVSIARGASEHIGPWTVTNLQSLYLHGGESVWFRAVTLLGPGDTHDVDAGI